MASIKDVAKLAGVSIGTVSNVLNNSRYVSPERADRVRKAVEELNFSINPMASSLKGKRTNTIGLVATNITRVFYSHVITGMQKAAAENGYTLSIFSTYNKFDAEQEAVERFRINMVDAIIIDTSAPLSNMDYFIHLASLRNKEKHIPTMSIEINLTQYGISSIFVDGMQAAEEAVSYLVGLGCAKIAHIQGPQSSSLSRERLIGYKKAVINAGMPIRDDYILSGDFSQYSGYASMKRFMESGTAFDGVFCANDQMAIGACKAIARYGLKIPDDVKVVGFDNSFIASIVSPSISTVDVPKEEMGYRAVTEVIEAIKAEKIKCQSICMPTKMVIRESTEKNDSIDDAPYDW